MLDQLLPNDLFSIALVFMRIGAAMMLLPGFGESYVTPKIRLIIALALSLVVAPVVSASLPPMPSRSRARRSSSCSKSVCRSC